MTIQFTFNGSYALDESAGLQTPATTDTGNDISLATLQTDALVFYNRLVTLFGADFNGASSFPNMVGAAKSASNLLTVTSTGTLSGLTLTDTGGGTLNGDPSGVSTVNGTAITLWLDSTNPNIILGRAGAAATDPIAFAVYMKPVLSADGKTATIQFFTVTFQPLFHIDGTNADDAVDLLQNVRIAATEQTEFNFNLLPSGQNLFGIVGPSKDSAAIAVIGKNITLNADGTFKTGQNSSDTINTSQGGGNVTIGVNNQAFDQIGEGAYFTYINKPVESFLAGAPNGLDQNEADDADNILYSGGTVEVNSGFFRIVQNTGSTLATAKITAYDIAGAPQGTAFVNSLGTGTVRAITAVRVFNASGTKIEDTADLGNFNSPTVSVTFSGGVATVSGLTSGYKVEFDTINPADPNGPTSLHDRVLIENAGGSFDIGAFGISQPGGASTSLANRAFVQDDGPTAAINTTGTKVVHDESPGLQTGGVAVPGEDNNDDDKDAGINGSLLPAEFQAIAGIDLTKTVGWAQSASAVVTTSGSSTGTDGNGSIVTALKLSGTNVDSDLRDLAGKKILLNIENGIVVGRVDVGNDGSVAGDPVAIAIKLESDNKVSIAQFVPLRNPDGDDPDDQVTIKSGVLFVEVTAADKDGDSKKAEVDIGDKIGFEDDGPAPLGSGAPTKIEEDDLDNAQSKGNNEDASVNKHTSTVELSTFLSAGVDTPASFNLKNLTPAQLAAALPALLSKGDAVTYALELEIGGPGGDDKITASAGGRTVFTFVLEQDGTAIFTLIDQIDHVAGGGENLAMRLVGGGSVNVIDFATLLDVRDADTDKVTLPTDVVAYQIEDDVPLLGPIANGIVDFTTINGANPNDFGGTSVNTVTKSLNGSIGADEKASPYTITAFTSSITTGGITLKGTLNGSSTAVTYYQDKNNNNVFDAGDVKFYDLVLDQTANSGAGAYTFTVYQNPPPTFLEFDFRSLPSGQNLFGIIGKTANDPGLLVIGGSVVLKADGTYANTSDTINTSQGGGPTTIGVNNQMFDPGESAWFVYINKPTASYIAGAPGGLDQNEADNAHNIEFNGTVPATTSQVEIVQLQGNALATMRIAAYDIVTPAVPAGLTMTDAQSRAFALDPLALGQENLPRPEITRVKVFDSLGNLREDSNLGGVQDPDIVINLNPVGDALAAVISGLHAGDTIEFTTDKPHDAVKVTGEGGKFDIGGFNILNAQPTPDQVLDFTVQIADFDGDTASASFKIGIDGTGVFDNDSVLFV